jgi:hypothetical protein
MHIYEVCQSTLSILWILIFERLNFFQIIYKNSNLTSQETYYVSHAKKNRLILFRETRAVNYEKHKKHIKKLKGQKAEFWYVKEYGSYSNHWALKG